MSQRNSGRERVANDLYETKEAWVTKALAEHVDLNGKRVWECACGSGHMVRHLITVGATVSATDVQDFTTSLGPIFRGPYDFLSDRPCPWVDEFDIIVTNPPYGPRGETATAFIAWGIGHIRRHGAMALLLPIDFDSAKGRRHLFDESPYYVGKIVLRRRIRWFDPPPPKPGEKKKKTGPSSNHAWFIWQAPLFRHRRPPFTLYGPSEKLARAA